MRGSVRSRVEVRRTEYGQGESSEAKRAQCPVRGESVPVEECLGCPRYLGLGGAGKELYVECRVAEPLGEAPPDLLAKCFSTVVSDVMTRDVTCLDSELDLPEVAEVLARAGVSGAPVVEDEGVLLGVVSRGDLMRGGPEGSDPARAIGLPSAPGVLVEDVMSKSPVSVRETAPLAEAIHLFGETRVHRLPVVSREDVVVGILSAIDVLVWLAQELPDADCRGEPEISS